MQGYKRIAVATWPYAVALGVGSLLYFLSRYLTDDDARGFALGIAGAFIAIPLLYLTYGLAQKFSRHRLSKELFEYAKFQIDTEVFKAVRYLMKSVWPYERHDLTLRGIQKFLDHGREECGEILRKSTLYGFQILRRWEVSQKVFESTLQNPLIIKNLSEEQATVVIQLLKSIRTLEGLSRNIRHYFEPNGVVASGYSVKSGKELNEGNIDYPDRYLLIRSLGSDKYVVVDFADFPQYLVPHLLEGFVARESVIEYLLDCIFDFVSASDSWITLTGGELLLDLQIIRLSHDIRPESSPSVGGA